MVDGWQLHMDKHALRSAAMGSEEADLREWMIAGTTNGKILRQEVASMLPASVLGVQVRTVSTTWPQGHPRAHAARVSPALAHRIAMDTPLLRSPAISRDGHSLPRPAVMSCLLALEPMPHVRVRWRGRSQGTWYSTCAQRPARRLRSSSRCSMVRPSAMARQAEQQPERTRAVWWSQMTTTRCARTRSSSGSPTWARPRPLCSSPYTMPRKCLALRQRQRARVAAMTASSATYRARGTARHASIRRSSSAGSPSSAFAPTPCSSTLPCVAPLCSRWVPRARMRMHMHMHMHMRMQAAADRAGARRVTRMHACAWRACTGSARVSTPRMCAPHVLRMHAPQVGGLMSYSTCSLNPIENESVVAALLQRCGGALELVDGAAAIATSLCGGCAPGMTSWRVYDSKMRAHESLESVRAAADLPAAEVRKFVKSMWPPKPPKPTPGPVTSTNATAASGPDPGASGVPPMNRHERRVAAGIATAAAAWSPPPLARCVRLMPNRSESGGFFVALLRKVAPLPATPTPPWPRTPATADTDAPRAGPGGTARNGAPEGIDSYSYMAVSLTTLKQCAALVAAEGLAPSVEAAHRLLHGRLFRRGVDRTGEPLGASSAVSTGGDGGGGGDGHISRCAGTAMGGQGIVYLSRDCERLVTAGRDSSAGSTAGSSAGSSAGSLNVVHAGATVFKRRRRRHSVTMAVATQAAASPTAGQSAPSDWVLTPAGRSLMARLQANGSCDERARADT